MAKEVISDKGPRYSLFGLVGVGLAAYLSWEQWHSVAWAVINGIFGWFYVVYFGIMYGIK